MAKTEGRMIKKSISDSKGFASLSPEAAVLFCMIIPHLNAYGKMNGGPGYVKDEVCPRVKYLTLELVESCLREIGQKTAVKWFDHDGRKWIHSVNFLKNHQKLPTDKLGQDLLPSYSGVGCEVVRSEVEVEVKEEVEVEVKVEDIMSGKNPDDEQSPRQVIPYQRVLNSVNEILKTNFKNTDGFKKLVKARIREGFSEEDFSEVCRKQLQSWGNDPKMSAFLRPETLFGGKMNSYLGGNGSMRPMSERERVNRAAGEAFLRGEF